VQLALKLKFNVDPLTKKSILKWHGNFIERGCICVQRKGHSGRPSVSVQVVDRVRESYLAQPQEVNAQSYPRVKIPQSTEARSYADACGYTLISCNWSKSYTRKTRKRDMHFAGISKR